MSELGVVKYDITNVAIKQMETDYMVLTVQGLEDEVGFNQVHEARMIVKTHRVAVEKKRKDLKAGALEFGRKVDSEAKRITALLEPIETHLQTEEDKVTKEKERIRAEKIRLEQERVEGIRAKIENMKAIPSRITLTPLSHIAEVYQALLDWEPVSEANYQEFTHEAIAVFEGTLSAVLKIKDDREKWEQEQAAAKAEAERLEKVRKEQEAEATKLKAAQDKIDAEKAALEAEKRTDQERKDREKFEHQAKEEARIVAEKEAAEKIEAEKTAQEAAAHAELDRLEALAVEKARKEALKPDKAKIITWARELNRRLLDMRPNLSSPEARRIMDAAEGTIDISISTAVKNAKEL